MARPGPLRLILCLQFVAIPFAFAAGVVAAFASTPLLPFMAAPAPFYAVAVFFMTAGPIVHAVLAIGLLIERAWAWQRANVLAWVVLIGESVFVAMGSVMLEFTVLLWLAPLLAIGVATLVYLRDPRVEAHLGTAF